MEKEKRFLVVILAFILFRIWFIAPYISILETGQSEYAALSRSVVKAETVLNGAVNRQEYLQSIKTAARENSSFLMSVDLQSRDALASMQKKLRDSLEEMGFEVTSVTWGEPYTPKGAQYVRLPLSFVATSNSDGLHKFLEVIGRRKPLLLFDSLSVTSRRKGLRVQGQIISFIRASEPPTGVVSRPEVP